MSPDSQELPSSSESTLERIATLWEFVDVHASFSPFLRQALCSSGWHVTLWPRLFLSLQQYRLCPEVRAGEPGVHHRCGCRDLQKGPQLVVQYAKHQWIVRFQSAVLVYKLYLKTLKTQKYNIITFHFTVFLLDLVFCQVENSISQLTTGLCKLFVDSESKVCSKGVFFFGQL